MTTQLGELFHASAREPFVAASNCFNRSRLGDGLRALDRENLEAGFQKGVATLVQLTGLPASAIEGAMPYQELSGALDLTHKSQQKLLKSVRRQEMTVASFGIPRELAAASSPVAHLRELAETYARDKDISGGFRALAADTEALEALLARCVQAIDESPTLLASLRQRRLRRALLTYGSAGLLLLVLVGISAFAIQRSLRAQEEAAAAAAQQEAKARAQQRITASLARPDVCAPDDLSPEDRALLDDAQRSQLASRKQRCEQEQKAREQRQRCETLLAHVDRNQLTPEDAALAGPSEGLLRHVAARSLQAPDLLAGEAEMPCADQPVSGKLWELYARAAVASPMLWGLAEGISRRAATELSKPGQLPPDASLRTIAFHAERVATLALQHGREPEVGRARSLCEYKSALGQALALSCEKVRKLPRPPTP
jgi:hypothetical protein